MQKIDEFIKKHFVLCAGSIIIFFALFILILNIIHPARYIRSDENTLTVYDTQVINGEAYQKQVEIPRGTKTRIVKRKQDSCIISYKKKNYVVPNKNLTKSFQDAMHSDYVYARRLINLHEQKSGKLSKVVLKKNEKVKVLSIDYKDWDENTGILKWYKIEKNNKEYYVNGKYVETTKKLANKNYAKNISYSTYWDAYYKNGYAKKAYIDQVDYKPEKKQTYASNTMPKKVHAVHVSMENFVNNAKYLQNLKGINTIVVEVKSDEGLLFYQSSICKEYLSDPSIALQSATLSKKDLSKLVKQYKQKHIYVVGRIVTFKDAVFASENPKDSLTDKKGNLVLYNNQYWPSAYSRKAWMYNVDIAKECADLGFNEIQFDYVRFPDGTTTAMDQLNFHNTYHESKVSAIQGFLQYAKDELSEKKVYVAADIFAWPIVSNDDQDIGQFLPAIANVVDVVCPMPYLDHFSSGSFNIKDPANHPYKTMDAFSKVAKSQINSVTYPSKYRSWIQGYNQKSKDIKAQIQALKDNDFNDYMVWLSSGSYEDIHKIEKGFVSKK